MLQGIRALSHARPAAGLSAGTIAIFANTTALSIADLMPLATAHGGLLRLLSQMSGIVAPSGRAFQTGFHIVVGLGMALLYAVVLEPLLTGPAWLKGVQYAFAMWMVNAVIVLPLADEGFAGSRHLSFAGMIWFAAAHTLFFVLLAILFQRFRPPGDIC